MIVGSIPICAGNMTKHSVESGSARYLANRTVCRERNVLIHGSIYLPCNIRDGRVKLIRKLLKKSVHT